MDQKSIEQRAEHLRCVGGVSEDRDVHKIISFFYSRGLWKNRHAREKLTFSLDLATSSFNCESLAYLARNASNAKAQRGDWDTGFAPRNTQIATDFSQHGLQLSLTVEQHPVDTEGSCQKIPLA